MTFALPSLAAVALLPLLRRRHDRTVDRRLQEGH